MKCEHFYFLTKFLAQKLVVLFFFRPEYTISDEIIELNSVRNRILVSCESAD
jgi:hypothetical protein